jgi:ketosteroid isomerase-like protein
LALGRSRWSDDAGNETIQLILHEVDEDGRISFEGRFDDDGFGAAFGELEQRYYAGEGAAYAAGGALQTDYFAALTRGDLDTVFGDLSAPDFRMTNRSRSVFGNRSAAEVRASVEELAAMVASARTWISAVHWASSTCGVFRFEREAVGLDGEQYAWTRLSVAEIQDGRISSICEFDLDDEEEAFAYAEELVAAPLSRLAVTNRASEVTSGVATAMSNHDVDAVIACCSESWEYDDRRVLSGGPLEGLDALRTAVERIFAQYSRFEGHTLAVRGELMALGRSRWSDDCGNETGHLHLIELGDDGLITHEVRFDDDDFEGAYRELERKGLRARLIG